MFGPLVAGGRRASTDPRGYALVVESIFEGYLLHYGRGRIVEDPDPDLRLLAGDHLYAFGLARLANIGDLEAVDELADLISLCAQAHAARTGARRPPAVAADRRACGRRAVLAVAGGPWPEQREAQARCPRAGSGGNRESAGCRKRSRARARARASTGARPDSFSTERSRASLSAT